MKKILEIILLAISLNLFSQSNVIRNSSFEELDNTSPIQYPTHEGQVYQWQDPEIKYLKYWESRSFCHPDSEIWNCYPAHSPDWFKIGGQGYFGLLIPPPDGASCIGMTNYELIQQELNSTLYSNNWYSFNGNLFLGTTNFQVSYDYSGCNQTELILYLAKKKINYNRERISALDVCINGNYNHQDGLLQDIIILKKFILNTSDFTPDTWQNFEFLFRTPNINNIAAYNWLGIELRKIGYNGESTDGSCGTCYVRLDNLQLFNIESDPCCSIDGDINEFSSNSFSVNSNPWVCHATNITGYDMNVFDRWGNNVYSKSEFNPNGLDNDNDIGTINNPHPIYSIYWNGTNYSGNFLYNAGPFNITLVLYNCQLSIVKTKMAQIYESLENGEVATIYPPIYNTDSPVNYERADCCTYNRYFNTTPQRQECIYEAVNQIVGGNNCIITSNQNITFKAGNAVILNPGFQVQSGAFFEAKILPCGVQRLANFSYETIDSSNFELISPITISESKLFLIKNQLNIINNKEMNTLLEIYNANGKLVYYNIINDDVHLNLNHFSEGMYLVKLQGNNNTYVKKIVLLND